MKGKKIFGVILSILFTFSLTSCIKLDYTGIPNTTKEAQIDFTATEKSKMQGEYGALIPFLGNHTYYIRDTFNDNLTMHYTVEKVSKSDFNSYLENFKNFELKATRIDDSFLYSGTYYTYFDQEKDVYYDILLKPLSFSNTLNVYMYKKGDYNLDYESYSNINHPIDNIGDKVSFKNTAYQTVKDVSSTSNVCPAKGNVKILVVPVQFPNVKRTTGESTIKNVLFEHENSLKNYYYKSSYGKLNLSFEIVNEWYLAKNNYTYYREDNVNSILDEVLDYYDNKYDYSSFDSDNDGYIDGVILVTSNKENYKEEISWPTVRFYTSKERDNVSSYAYCHVPFESIKEKDDSSNLYTICHEFGHVLGLDDYYDTSYTERTIINPITEDLMNAEFKDHNPFSKAILGWIDEAKFVSRDSTVSLSSFQETGDFIIVSNNFDLNMGAFQEYYIIAYYTTNVLSEDQNKKYIAMYHVDGSVGEYLGLSFMQYNNTVSGFYSTKNFLIENITGFDTPYIMDLTTDSITLDFKDNNGLPLKFTLTQSIEAQDKINLTFKF